LHAAGRGGEFLELHKALSFKTDYARVRLYSPGIRPHVFVSELVVASEESRNRLSAEFNATPEADAFWEKFDAPAERQVSTERCTVTEIGECHSVRCA
jgi:hypothetical protein